VGQCFFYRVGQVVGARRNFIDLLHSGEICAVFPTARGHRQAVHAALYTWLNSMSVLSNSSRRQKRRSSRLRCRAVRAGADAGHIKPLARRTGLPVFPITPLFPLLGPMGFIPLPTQYPICYGKPIRILPEY
jgi:hypothetical protein